MPECSFVAVAAMASLAFRASSSASAILFVRLILRSLGGCILGSLPGGFRFQTRVLCSDNGPGGRQLRRLRVPVGRGKASNRRVSS